MTQPVELLPNVFAVKVPKDSYNHDVFYGNLASEWILTYEIGLHDYDHEFIDSTLPKGNWSIIGVGISEEVAGKIVGTEINGDGKVAYLNYTGDYGDKNSRYYGCFMFDTAIASLISLLKSKGLDQEDNFVFLTLNK